MVVTAFGTFLRVDAAPPDVKPAPTPTSPADGRTWKGKITEKGSGKPVADADVVVEISVSRDRTTNDWKSLREVRQTTGADGAYEFTLSREEEADRYLYITLRVDARDHVNYFGGYGYAMILKNEKLGERPFYENLALAPGAAVEGVVKTPGGAPAVGVKVQAFSAPDPERVFDDGRWPRRRPTHRVRPSRAAPKGQGRPVGPPPGLLPETHGLKDGRRGDLGTFTLEPGVRFGGKVLDAQGKPVAGVYVEADLRQERGRRRGPQRRGRHEAPRDLDRGRRVVRVPATPPGKYRVYPSERGWDPPPATVRTTRPGRPLPGVFTAQRVALKEGETPEPVEIRAAPLTSWSRHSFITARGRNDRATEVGLVGRIDGDFWSAECRCTADGAYRILAPHGLDDAQLSLITNEHSVLQFRTSRDAPLRHNRDVRLGTLDHDVKGIEIIRYEAPIIVIGAATTDGKPVQGIKPSVDYTEPDPERSGKFILKGGVQSDVSLEQQGDRYRTSQLAPDREVLVTVLADGYAPASRKLKLAEGKVEELTLVLEPK
ncbi:MAG: hypothetical protein U0835_08865 [Isosphaeraceae bacterium]